MPEITEETLREKIWYDFQDVKHLITDKMEVIMTGGDLGNSTVLGIVYEELGSHYLLHNQDGKNGSCPVDFEKCCRKYKTEYSWVLTSRGLQIYIQNNGNRKEPELSELEKFTKTVNCIEKTKLTDPRLVFQAIEKDRQYCLNTLIHKMKNCVCLFESLLMKRDTEGENDWVRDGEVCYGFGRLQWKMTVSPSRANMLKELMEKRNYKNMKDIVANAKKQMEEL